MTPSLTKKIIKGATVQGVVFCGPNGELEQKESVEFSDTENLKALEDLWRHKGLTEGKKLGFEEGFEAGKQEAYAAGKQAGEKQGREDGLKEGIDKGKIVYQEESKEHLAKSLKAIHKVYEEILSEKQRQFELSKSEIIKFCFSACKSILRKELSEPEHYTKYLEYLIQVAQNIIAEQDLVIWVSPKDKCVMDSYIEVKDLSSLGIKKVVINEDEELQAGDIRIESVLGMLNHRISRHIEDLQKKTLEVRRSEK